MSTAKRALFSHTTLPIIGSPMFLVSGPELVIAQCNAGVVGCFPSLNARPQEQLAIWLQRIAQDRDDAGQQVPYGVNLIVHPSNPRWESDLVICAEHRVPLFITSLHAPHKVVETAHSYGGIVLHDVTNVKHAKKAIEAGVDGLILVAGGAGGHAGQMNPFALINEIRGFYDGLLGLAGCIAHGKDIMAAQVMGADFVYMGTRFIAAQESLAVSDYKQMVLESHAADVVYTPYFSGVAANYLLPSIIKAGVDPAELHQSSSVVNLNKDTKPKAWRDIWGAGQGVGATQSIQTVQVVVQQLQNEYSKERTKWASA